MKISAHVGPVVHVAIVAVFVVACTLAAAAARGASAFLLLRHRHRPPRSVSPLIIARNDAGRERRRTTASCWWLLAYYPNDETLSERLRNVKDEWDDVRKDGIGKFLSDEFELAEKLMLGNAQSAVKEANDVMERGGGATATVEMSSSSSSSSSSGVGDDYLLKGGFHAMATAGERLAGEVRAVRQELDVSRAARGVEGAAEDVVGADVLIERGECRASLLIRFREKEGNTMYSCRGGVLTHLFFASRAVTRSGKGRGPCRFLPEGGGRGRAVGDCRRVGVGGGTHGQGQSRSDRQTRG